MSERSRKPVLGRADRVLPGVWRLRLPLPWPGVPHCNAWALAAGSGVVLVDTGIYGPGTLGQFERALEQAGLRLEHVRLLVCTHAHSDHYGLAAPIVESAGCELWMHPNHGHVTRVADDPDRMLDRRIEIARQSGVPEHTVREYESRRGQRMGVAGVVLPDRDLVRGVELETDHGVWQVHETPGHAPSHVVLHQPERGLLISGDHLLVRVSLYYDYGHTPDPAGEFIESLGVVDDLDARLCLPGHGRPFRDVHGHVEANRREVAARIARVRGALDGRPVTPFEIVPILLETEEVSPMMLNWGLSEVLCYLRHLEQREEAHRVAAADSGGAERWAGV
jgi:glyoxylase-like metal-dependent hydrolase (beta-lactamase superfamily II)